MLRAYKAELNPTEKQKQKINQSIGICRWLYNHYLAKNKQLYEDYKNNLISKSDAFMSANYFDKYINNEVKVLDKYKWISNCGSKARKKAIYNAEIAYKRFFKGQSQSPRFKKKGKSNVGLYFPKNNKGDWTIERHKVKIPTLGFVRVKEFGYIPINNKVVSGTIIEKNGRYYVSVLCEVEVESNLKPRTQAIGIDLGIKDFAICSNNMVFKNINKTSSIKKLEKKLKREQCKLSRKYEMLKKRGGSATKQNISKQKLKVARLHERLTNIRTDYVNKVISQLIEQNPSSITIEELNVKGMMSNKHLSKSVAQQKFYEFRVKLANKCNQNDIELRIVDRWYPSSKTCSQCGSHKSDLKLSDRTYKCDSCGIEIDRDYNASLNLKYATTYKLAS